MEARKFSEVNYHQLIDSSLRDFFTWPLNPAGILKETRHQYDVSKDSEQLNRDIADVDKIMNNWFQSKSTVMTFIIAIVIGILGNLFTSIVLIENIQIYYSYFSILLFVIIIIFTFLGSLYIPSYSKRYLIMAEYQSFPKGYETYIDIEQIKDKDMKIKIAINSLDEVINNYSVFIRNFLIRDSILKCLSDSKYLKVISYDQLSPFFPSFELEVKTNLFALLKPKNQRDVILEFIRLNEAVLNAKMNSGVYALELGKDEWKQYGTVAINEISHLANNWTLLNKMLEDTIRKSTNWSLSNFSSKLCTAQYIIRNK